MEPIESVSGGIRPAQGADPTSGRAPAGADFKEMLARYLDQVNSLQQKADLAVRDVATGKVESIHEVIAAGAEADLSFRLMMQVRNRLVDAYKEIMRMQV